MIVSPFAEEFNLSRDKPIRVKLERVLLARYTDLEDNIDAID